MNEDDRRLTALARRTVRLERARTDWEAALTAARASKIPLRRVAAAAGISPEHVRRLERAAALEARRARGRELAAKRRAT